MLNKSLSFGLVFLILQVPKLAIAYMSDEKFFLHIQTATMHINNSETFIDVNNIPAACREGKKGIAKFYELNRERDVAPNVRPYYDKAFESAKNYAQLLKKLCG